MGELLKHVAAEARTDELKTQLRKVGSAFLTHREVSAQEAVYRILSLPMKHLSRSVVFVQRMRELQTIYLLLSLMMMIPMYFRRASLIDTSIGHKNFSLRV